MSGLGRPGHLANHSNPRIVVLSVPEKHRFGRWHALRPTHMTAFLMGLHEKFAAVGDHTAYSNLDFPEELPAVIFNHTRVRSRPGTSAGFQHMLGSDVP